MFQWPYRFHLLLTLFVTRGFQLSSTDQEYILQLHSNVRNNLSPPPREMYIPVYSLELEELADKWANSCVWKRPEDAEFVGLGLNAAAIGREGKQPDMQELFDIWLRGAKHYTYDTNTCTAFCAHYMQVIWDNTEAIGCALHFCNGTKDARHVLACVYKPEANSDVRRPYTTGKGSEVKATDEEDEEEEEEAAEGGDSKSTKGEGKGGTDGKGKENETKKKKKEEPEQEEEEMENSGPHIVAFKSFLLLLCTFLFLVS